MNLSLSASETSSIRASSHAQNVDCPGLNPEGHNDCLEFLGNVVLSLIVTKSCIQDPDKNEGFLTRIGTKLVLKSHV